MENRIGSLVTDALNRLRTEGKVPPDFNPAVAIERPKHEAFGDFGCALPLAMTRVLRRPPAECAQALISAMDLPEGLFEFVQFAPPGYVNFKVAPGAWFNLLDHLDEIPQVGAGERVLLEFVSANPTGPLHVGHGRGAVLGDAVARLMRAAGFQVETEYLLNDVGNQMAMLGLSIHSRGREILGLPVEFPENGYQGEYLRLLAREFVATTEGRAACEADYEALGTRDDNAAVAFASDRLLADIQDVLDRLDIRFDHWFRESSLHKSGMITTSVEALIRSDAAYRDESGAVLFRMQDADDDEDRVIIRGNGVPTYFAADIAYHDEKAGRGYSRLINIWGADHHGYIPRVRAALAACGRDPDLLQVLLVQMVTLTRGGEVIPMGKRAGKFVTLRDVVDEVGTDAVRFLFLLRKADSQMEFDLDLARSQTMDNPVYYVQYGHARVASILRKAATLGYEVPEREDAFLGALALPEEQMIIRDLCRYPGVVASAGARGEPHHLAFYLMDLVKSFHSYYTRYKQSERVLSDDVGKTRARLFMVAMVQRVLGRGLGLLGVHAPEEMHHSGEDEPV
jgi:arginyl-tRNA synthetase